MNKQELLALLQSRGLLAWQANFAASFLEANSPDFHLLAAPPGTGKMYASSAILPELVREGARRMLVLAPASLCEAWKERLGQAQSEVPVLLVTRRVLREIEADLPIGQSSWDADGIYVTSQDLAKQKDVAAGLSAVSWDLVLVDEAHRLVAPQRAALLDRLMAANVVRRLLLLSPIPPSMLNELLQSAHIQPVCFSSSLFVTEWFDVVKNWDGSPVDRLRVEWRAVPYTRSDDEVKCLSLFLGSMEELEMASSGNKFLIQLLTQRASSSLFGFEQSLRRLGITLKLGNEAVEVLLAKAGDAQADTPVTLDDVEPTSGERRFEWVDRQGGLGIINQTLEALETISTDEKLKALKRLIQSVVAAEKDVVPRICVFSSYADTLSYLHTALDDIGLPMFKVTGDSSFTKRQSTVQRFLNEGGLILGTDAALSEGIAMPQVKHVVHYDLPWNPIVVEQRRGRFDRFGRQTPLSMYVLRDESGVIPREFELSLLVNSVQRTGIGDVQINLES